jgi:hypothetical protein
MVGADETFLLIKQSGKHCRRRKAFARGVAVRSAKFEIGVYPGRAGVNVYNLQRSRITGQKRGNSDDLFIPAPISVVRAKGHRVEMPLQRRLMMGRIGET